MPVTNGGGSNVVDVLLVEDDPGDVLMTREAFDPSASTSLRSSAGTATGRRSPATARWSCARSSA